MPSTSQKQHNLMAMVANNPAAAKRMGIPQSVGQDFMQADKGLKFGKGDSSRADLQKINRPKTNQGKSELFARGGDMKESKAMVGKELSFMKKKGAPASMMKHEMAEADMKKGGKAKKMASGGLAAGHKSADGIASKGKTKGKDIVMKRGGKVC
jgi:hypothetical protein